MSKDHNISSLKQYKGVSFLVSWFVFLVFNLFFGGKLHQAQGLSDLLKTNVEKGITGDDDDLMKRKTIYGSNTYPRKKGKGFLV